MIKKLFLIISVFILNTQATAQEITKTVIINKQRAYKEYLDSLSSQVSYPFWVIKKGMQWSSDNYSETEIDAVPAAFPFLCEKKYVGLMHSIKSDEFVLKVNEMLTKFYKSASRASTIIEKRQMLHHIFHEHNCKKLKLSHNTTTKELSDMVQTCQVDMNLFFEEQMVQFFVKFLLHL